MKKFEIWDLLITIFIGIVGIYISWQANKMSALQAEIARSSSLPNITIDEKAVIEEETGQILDTTIEITNLDGRLNNYSSQIVTFLKCEYFDENDNYYSANIPVESYYIIGAKSGVNIGIIENKKTAFNYSKIELLKKDIQEYNKNSDDESITARLESYLKISYVNLLNEEVVVYYKTDTFETVLIDESDGEQMFAFYEEVKKQGWGVNPNISDKIFVNDLIDKICKTSEVEVEVQKEMEESDGGMVEIIGTFVSTIVGTFLAYCLGMKQQRDNDKRNEAHAASILYYDLKSIEDYLKNERSSVNLRYSADWQSIVASCSFLTNQQVKCIYDIYDKVYNYNYFYNQKERKRKSFSKEDVPQYNDLREIMFDVSKGYIDEKKYNFEYEDLLKELEKYVLR